MFQKWQACFEQVEDSIRGFLTFETWVVPTAKTHFFENLDSYKDSLPPTEISIQETQSAMQIFLAYFFSQPSIYLLYQTKLPFCVSVRSQGV